MERTIVRALLALALLGAAGGIFIAASSDDPRCYPLEPPPGDAVVAPSVEFEGEHPTEVCVYDGDEIVLPPAPIPPRVPFEGVDAGP